MVRGVGRLGHLGRLRRPEAAPLRRPDRRRLRRSALRERRSAHARRGAHHPDLHDLPHRAVPGGWRDRVGGLRHPAALRDDRARGEHGMLHGARRHEVELVHRVRADAHHGARAGAGAAGRRLARRWTDRARRVSRLDRAAHHGLVVHLARPRRAGPVVRAVDRGRALRADALLLYAGRRDRPLCNRDLDGHPGAHRLERDSRPGMRGLFPYRLRRRASSMASVVMSPPGSLFIVAMLSAIASTVNSRLVTGGAFAHDSTSASSHTRPKPGCSS